MRTGLVPEDGVSTIQPPKKSPSAMPAGAPMVTSTEAVPPAGTVIDRPSEDTVAGEVVPRWGASEGPVVVTVSSWDSV